MQSHLSTSCRYILSFPSCDTSCWLCSSRILILDSNFSLCSLNILASFRISASEDRGGTVDEGGPTPPEVALRCWYSS